VGRNMRLSLESLNKYSKSTGFRPEILEKVSILLSWLDKATENSKSEYQWTLKGGTAINIFFFDLPRLSIDIDINFLGCIDRTELNLKREDFENDVENICLEEKLSIRNKRSSEATTSYSLRYDSVMGAGGNLKVDISYMFRIPLFQNEFLKAKSAFFQSMKSVPVMNRNEVFASKLTAAFSRNAARDLFDISQFVKNIESFDLDKIRLGFIVFGAMNRKNWLEINEETIKINEQEIEHQLIPLLRKNLSETEKEMLHKDIETSIKRAKNILLPFTDKESKFLRELNENGEIKPELLTTSDDLIKKIKNHPQLKWKALNVKKHFGKS
jgi:hypothetical protein